MKAVLPVFFGPIGEPTRDVVMGAGQPQVEPLPVTVIERLGQIHIVAGPNPTHFISVSRWKLSDEERAAIAAGADIVHQVMHNPGAYPPMNLQVVEADKHPGIIR